ncbi:GNAT family N-acetyltransferase [Marinibactrum halimedae]|nr:N-acetyltransferase [Marinibactrum halimedae]
MGSYLEKDGVPNTDEENLNRIRYNFKDAQLIGFCGKLAGLFKASYLPHSHQWYLFQIQIHPDFQNKKIGSHLVKVLIDRASSQGAKVGLSVLKSNPAIKFYTDLGFKVIQEDDCEFELLYEE